MPGETATLQKGLRLGVRKGYLNFYVKGQSVALLSWGRTGPSISVHNAYVGKIRRGDPGGPTSGSTSYDSHALANTIPASLIDSWTETAETYSSAEKRFVDDLIAANPGVIDLEMALPANAVPGEERVAPRMDLVVVQIREDSPLSIGFWEAKCANNPELRANGEPRVLRQIGKYRDWLATGDRQAEVQIAYQNTANILIELHNVFRGNGSGQKCISYWQELGKNEAPMVARQAGIVIGNYWPMARNDLGDKCDMARYGQTFATNGHRGKLERASIVLHEVGPQHSAHELPPLPVKTT
jgi:hypothetical protein